MTVQIKPSKPKDQYNGLADLEAAMLKDPGKKVYAIVTYEVAKRVEDLAADETYPVLGIKHIEPIIGKLEQQAVDLQLTAYQSRTGENELDLNFEPEPASAGSVDEDGATVSEFPAGGKK